MIAATGSNNASTTTAKRSEGAFPFACLPVCLPGEQTFQEMEMEMENGFEVPAPAPRAGAVAGGGCVLTKGKA